MIPRGVVLAEIGGCVEDDVSPSKIVSELGYVPDVSYDYPSRGVSKFSPRFLFGPSQRPHLIARLQKSADQIVS
jgi:hypothetical protein